MKTTLSFINSDFKAYSALILLPLLVYMRSFWFGFSPMDEEWMIIKNEPFISDWGSLLSSFTQPAGEIYYRPFLLVSFITDYHISQLAPWMFHVTNVLLHILCVFLVFKVLQQYKVSKQLAFIFSLLFAIHPAMLHAVAWVPGRNDVLLAIFTLLALFFQNRYFENRKIYFLILHFFFFVCALFTKENAIVLPFVFAFNYFVRPSFSKAFVTLYFAMLICIGIAWFWLRSSIVPNTPPQFTDLGLSIKNTGMSFLVFIGKAILPFQQSVYPTLKTSSLWPGIITLAIMLLILLKIELKNKQVAYFGLFIFLILLVIPLWYGSSSINRELYEHRIYTSIFGLLIFFSQLKVNREGGSIKIILIGFGVIYLTLTLFRMHVYKDQLSYIKKGVKECPDNYFFQFRLADHLFAEKDYNGAIEHYTKAIALQPAKPMFYNNRANTYTALGNKNAALRDFDSAIVRSNYDPAVYLNRLATLLKFNEIERAMAELNKLKRCCQKMIPPDMEREIVYKWNKIGFMKISAEIQKHPDNATLYVNRAKLLYQQGMLKEAIIDLEKACNLEPQNENYKKHLGMVKGVLQLK